MVVLVGKVDSDTDDCHGADHVVVEEIATW